MAIDFTRYIVRLLALFLVLPIHEWAHAFAAYLLGDKTAKWDGRLSISPFRHLDLMGSLLMVFTGFGWAKPVTINPYNLKKAPNPKVGFAICAVAGPLANFIMAWIFMVVLKILTLYNLVNPAGMAFLQYLILINLMLMVFNLLPVPPLDGSRIWTMFLKDEFYNKLIMNEQKIMIVFFILVVFRVLEGPLMFLTNLMYSFVNILTGFIM